MQVPAQRVGQEVLGQVADELVLALEQAPASGFPRLSARCRRAACRCSRRPGADLVARTADRVEVFQRVADRVHLQVAVGATGALLAVLFELFAQGERPALGVLGVAVHGVVHGRRRRGRRGAEQRVQHPLAAVGRARPRRHGSLLVGDRHAEETAAAAIGQLHFLHLALSGIRIVLDALDVVELRQILVQERVIAVDQLDQATLFADQLGEDVGQLLAGRLGQRGRVVGEHHLVEQVRLLPAEQPLLGELGREPAALGVLHHAADLFAQHFRLVEVSGRRQVHQFRVGDARPEERRQPAGQLVVIDRGRLVVGGKGLGAVEELRHHQQCLDGVALVVEEVLAHGPGPVERLEDQLDLLVVGRPAEGHAGQQAQVLLGSLAGIQLVLTFPDLVPAVDRLLVAQVAKVPGRALDDAVGQHQVLFEQLRRKGQLSDLVVVAGLRAGLGQIAFHVRLELEQVADGVAILTAGDAAREGRAGVGRLGGLDLLDQPCRPSR